MTHTGYLVKGDVVTRISLKRITPLVQKGRDVYELIAVGEHGRISIFKLQSKE